MVEADAEKVNEELFVCGRNIAWNSYDCRRSAQADMGSYTCNVSGYSRRKICRRIRKLRWSGEGVPNITQRLKQLKMKVSEGFRVRFKPSEADLVSAYEYGYQFGCIVQNKEPIKPKKKGARTLVKCLVCWRNFRFFARDMSGVRSRKREFYRS